MIGQPSPRRRWLVAAVGLAVLIPVIWPGDVPFINDEPQLIASAVDANRNGRLATMGLFGTYGFTYGPGPTWVYQVLMTTGRDLVLVAALHAFLMSFVTAAALLWLSRSLGLWIWFVPVPLLSPYFWFYSRVLWDNPLLLPLGALAFAGYAAHLESGSSAGLRVAWVSLLAIPLVHLMGLAIVLPLGAHLLVVRWRAVWAHRLSLAMLTAAALWLAFPYWQYLASPRAAPPPTDGTVDGWVFPLTGGRLMTAGGLEYFYGADVVAGSLFSAAGAVSSIAHLLVWSGLGWSVIGVARALVQRRWTPRVHLAAIAVGAVACQSVIDGVSGRFQHPHYHNGTWIAFVLLAWLVVDAAVARGHLWRRGAVLATSSLAGALLLAVGGLAWTLHQTAGTRDVYGPTLANQQAIAKRLADFSPASDVQVQVNMWERFPHTPAILRALYRSRRLDLPTRSLVVRYASGNPRSGLIELADR